MTARTLEARALEWPQAADGWTIVAARTWPNGDRTTVAVGADADAWPERVERAAQRAATTAAGDPSGGWHWEGAGNSARAAELIATSGLAGATAGAVLGPLAVSAPAMGAALVAAVGAAAIALLVLGARTGHKNEAHAASLLAYLTDESGQRSAFASDSCAQRARIKTAAAPSNAAPA